MELSQSVGSKRSRGDIRLNRHRVVQERRRIRMRTHFDELRDQVVSSYQLIDCCSRSNEEKNPKGFHALAARSDPLTNQDDVLAGAISLMRHYSEMLRKERKQIQHASALADKHAVALSPSSTLHAFDGSTSSRTHGVSPAILTGEVAGLPASRTHLLSAAAAMAPETMSAPSQSGVSIVRSQSARSSNSSRSTLTSNTPSDTNPASARSSMQSASGIRNAVKSEVDDTDDTAAPNEPL